MPQPSVSYGGHSEIHHLVPCSKFFGAKYRKAHPPFQAVVCLVEKPEGSSTRSRAVCVDFPALPDLPRPPWLRFIPPTAIDPTTNTAGIDDAADQFREPWASLLPHPCDDPHDLPPTVPHVPRPRSPSPDNLVNTSLSTDLAPTVPRAPLPRPPSPTCSADIDTPSSGPKYVPPRAHILSGVAAYEDSTSAALIPFDLDGSDPRRSRTPARLSSSSPPNIYARPSPSRPRPFGAQWAQPPRPSSRASRRAPADVLPSGSAALPLPRFLPSPAPNPTLVSSPSLRVPLTWLLSAPHHLFSPRLPVCRLGSRPTHGHIPAPFPSQLATPQATVRLPPLSFHLRPRPFSFAPCPPSPLHHSGSRASHRSFHAHLPWQPFPLSCLSCPSPSSSPSPQPLRVHPQDSDASNPHPRPWSTRTPSPRHSSSNLDRNPACGSPQSSNRLRCRACTLARLWSSPPNQAHWRGGMVSSGKLAVFILKDTDQETLLDS